MKKKLIAIFLVFGLLVACSGSNEQNTAETKELEMQPSDCQLKTGYIQHTVQFNLKWDANASESEKFLQDAKRILSALPMVNNFEALRQIGTKNNYKYYFTMIFKNQEAYDAYNNHPDHVNFVKERWENEVTDFLEADFSILD